MKYLNKKRKEGLKNYFYELSKMTMGGLGLAGILQANTSPWIIITGMALAIIFFLVGLYLEGNDP